MQTKLVAPAASRNWREAALPLAQGVLFLMKCDFLADALGAFKTAFDTFTKETTGPEQLGYRLWCETFSYALAQALRECQVSIVQTDDELKSAIADYLAQSLDTDATFDEAALLAPTSFAGYRPIREAFPAFLRRIDPELPAGDPETWRSKLDDCLGRALVQAWSGDVARYDALIGQFSGPVAEGARREASWMRHYGRIRDKFEGAQVFSPDDADLGIKLKQVYVRLRCCWHDLIDVKGESPEDDCAALEDGRRTKRRVAHLDHLHEAMQAWLEAPEDKDAIRLVAGGPGSGKSSFARAFACETIAANRWRVIFVELQHFSLDSDLGDALATHLTKRGLDFHQDPFGWRRDDPRPYLVIFDGLDELARSDDRAADLTRRFVYNLKRLLHESEIKDRRIKAIVLGRSAAAEEGRKDATLERQALLHVLPLRPPTRSDLQLETDWHQATDKAAVPAEDIIDPRGILTSDERDQRELYWRSWRKAHHEADGTIPEGVTHRDLIGLNAEPLLLHLLIVSGYMTPDKWQQAADNRNVVYQAIFEKVFARDKAKDSWTAAQLDLQDFFTLMECLGLASWAGGGRTGSDEDFQQLRGCHATRHQEKKFETLPNADLRGVALQFYTRQELDADTGFEFIHKSFGEYLIARAMLARARRMAADENATNQELGRLWLQICGHAAITPEILRFLRDQARLMPLDEAARQKQALEDLMSWSLAHGLPAQQMGGAEDYRTIESRQRHGEGNLLAALNALARRLAADGVKRAIIAPRWPGPDGFRRMAKRLLMTGGAGSVLKHCLEHVAFAPTSTDQRVERADLIGLWLLGANLGGADLTGADLMEANLRRADLTGADLTGADLRGANLRRADLTGADLRHADLREADLTGADLMEANLRRADLTGADLRHADLREADLTGADLRGADLRHADLREADLTGADLRHADLREADLTGADLRGAHLRGTKMPPGVH